jgi:hypothetical protein
LAFCSPTTLAPARQHGRARHQGSGSDRSHPDPLSRAADIQWRDELLRWFNEPFAMIFSAVDQQQLVNPWQRAPQVIASLDYAKQDSVRERVWHVRWGLVIIDEAHKCSAYTAFGNRNCHNPSVLWSGRGLSLRDVSVAHRPGGKNGFVCCHSARSYSPTLLPEVRRSNVARPHLPMQTKL